MTRNVEQDEHIEQLWYMKEKGKTSLDMLKRSMKKTYDVKVVEGLFSAGLVDLDRNAETIKLTPEGEARARQLIRAHRLAERLMADVLGGGDLEQIACEFEHTVSLELVNGICMLLGHPKQCPHGHPIPEGECCKLAKRTEFSLIIPVTELKVGESARIAYINSKNDQQLHKLEGLCVRPGIVIKLHQRFPTYVIECEGASIALDKDVVANISVWKNFQNSEQALETKTAGRKENAGGLKRFFNSIFRNSVIK